MRMLMNVAVTVLFMIGCGTGIYFWYQHYQQPTLRSEISEPLYTVDSSNVVKAVAEGQKVVELGPLPGSAFYAGALAFKQPEEALVWLKSTGKYDEGWRIFELSGDFSLDTHLIRGLPYTNKTLQISREVALAP